MKPRLIFFILFLPSLVSAQLSNLINDNYVTFSAGPAVYINHTGAAFGGSAGIIYGKWMLSTAGIRARLSASSCGSETIIYGNADIFFDPITTFVGRKPSDIMRTWILVGAGIVHTLNGDNDYCGSIGVGADWKMGKNWHFVSELHSYIHPSDFDDNTRSSFLPALELGFTRDINSNPTRSRSHNETRCFGNDWFFEVALGVCSFNYKGAGSLSDRVRLLTPNFEFGVGKRLTRPWSVRLAATGLYSRTDTELFSYYAIHGDLILDLAASLLETRNRTLFNLKPYASSCVVSRLDDQSHFLFSLASGALLSIRPDDYNEVSFDARYLFTPQRFAHVDKRQSSLSVGMATLFITYSHFFTHSSFATPHSAQGRQR